MIKEIQKLLDAELLDYREAYILDARMNNKTFEEIAEDLKLSRQRVHSIYSKIKYRLRLPKCEEVMFGIKMQEISELDKIDTIISYDIPLGACLKLFKYGVCRSRLRHFTIDEIASIKGISKVTAKKILKKI